VPLRVNQWYRVKSTGQYCRIQRIPSASDPAVSAPTVDENTRGFELALEWFAPSGGEPKTWTKRVMIMDVKKALGLLREPTEEDQEVIARIRKVAASLPIASASRDGEFTWRL